MGLGARLREYLIGLIPVLVLLVLPVPAFSASIEAAPASTPVELPAAPPAAEISVVPVIIDGIELFHVRGISAFPAERRARSIEARIETIAANHAISPQSLTVKPEERGLQIAAGDQFVMIVIEEDARLERAPLKIVADLYKGRIAEAIGAYRSDRSPAFIVHASLYAAGATAALILFLWLGGWSMRRLDVALEARIKRRLEVVEVKSWRFLSAENVWHLLRGLRSLIWSAAALGAVVIWLNFVLQLFPWTRWLGRRLLALLVKPLHAIGHDILITIPDLIFLVVLFLVTRYLLKIVSFFFDGLAVGRVNIAGFDREWAWPTYRLVRLIIVIFAVVIAYPYIPGSESNAFKGITVFLGIIFSIGSSAMIGNVIAGYSIAYRRAFRVGDRIQVNGHVGDVVELRLLVTRLRTPKNEEVIVPNSVILNSSVVNYSELAREGQLILHALVGIGYETPWRQVEAMLLQAAEQTEGLAKKHKPYVLKKALGDFAVTYEINVYCDDAHAMENLYSRLYQNILDVFNEYGVQIMTPAYRADPAHPKIVPKDQWYTAPATERR